MRVGAVDKLVVNLTGFKFFACELRKRVLTLDSCECQLSYHSASGSLPAQQACSPSFDSANRVFMLRTGMHIAA